MTPMSCSAVRRRLQAFYDRELPTREQIAVEAHISGCPRCGLELRDLAIVGDALRLGAAPGPADDWTGVAPGVISRMRAEQNESWTARAGRLFDDLHLVWIGMASTTATFVCATTVLSMLAFAPLERRDDSLAAVIAVMAAPMGSDVNPFRFDRRVQMPSVPDSGAVYEALENQTSSDADCEVTFAAVVNREGRVAGLTVLGGGADTRETQGLMEGLTDAHLEPAQYYGSPVAANIVWHVTHTTVKGKIRS